MHFTKGITLALMFSITVTTSRAQVTSKKSLTLYGARTIIAAAIAEAKKVNAPGGVIAVVDEGCQAGCRGSGDRSQKARLHRGNRRSG